MYIGEVIVGVVVKGVVVGVVARTEVVEVVVGRVVVEIVVRTEVVEVVIRGVVVMDVVVLRDEVGSLYMVTTINSTTAAIITQESSFCFTILVSLFFLT